MATCELTEVHETPHAGMAGWCERHKCWHAGRLYEHSQNDDKEQEARRVMWSMRADGEKVTQTEIDRRRGEFDPEWKKANPADGPGYEMEKILDRFGIGIGSCGCKAYARRMNKWGVDGCRERRQEIIERLKKERGKLGIVQRLAIIKNAALSSAALWMDLDEPVGSIVDESIRRADIIAQGVTLWPAR